MMPEHQVTAQGLEKEDTEFSIRSRLHARTLTIFKYPDQLYKGLSLVHQENRNSRHFWQNMEGDFTVRRLPSICRVRTLSSPKPHASISFPGPLFSPL